MEIPLEDHEPGDESKVAQLQMSLYGTRDAGLNWSKEIEAFMTSLGFTRGRACTANYRHSGRDLDVTVRGDDFIFVGSEHSVRWFIEKCRLKFEIKCELDSSSYSN